MALRDPRAWRLWTAALIGIALAGSFLGARPAHAQERPIVYAVVIDGLAGRAVDQGRAPFIRSLINGAEGARTHYYKESRSLMVGETNPNHAAMMTGAYSDRSGIAGNGFAIYGPTVDEDNCTLTGELDESRPPTVVSGENPSCLVAESLFQAVKRQGNPEALTTAAIFGKAKLGRIFAGKSPDGERWVDHLWAPCVPSGPDYEREYCATVPIDPIVQDRTLLDQIVMDEVIRSIREGVGPRNERPDFTFVNLQNVDNVGHILGGRSIGYELAIALADIEIRRLVDELKARGEWERTVLVLLSDHGHDTTLAKTSAADSFTKAGISEDAFTTVGNGGAVMVYLNDRTDPNRFELLRQMREVLLAQPGVDEALYREPNPLDGGEANTLDARRPGWKAAGPRNGDIIATHNLGGNFSDPAGGMPNFIPGNHGGSFTRDNFFAVTGGAPGIVHEQRTANWVDGRFDDTLINPDQAENADVAATVAGLFGLFAPTRNEGRFLDEAFDMRGIPGEGRSRQRLDLRAVRRGAVRSRGRTLRRYQVQWGPAGGDYQLQIRRSRRTSRGTRRFWRTVYRDRGLTSWSFRATRGRTYAFRARGRSASGRWGPWETLRFRAR